MKIPILNIYYLLCYAWDRLREGQIVDVSALDSHDLSNLFDVGTAGTWLLRKRDGKSQRDHRWNEKEFTTHIHL